LMNWFNLFFSKPLSSELEISSANGFHLRPVAQFVSVAKKYKADINATFKGKTVSAKAVNALLSLSLEKGDSFTLTCQGKDAQEAMQALNDIFHTLMQEDTEVAAIQKETSDYEGTTLEGEIIAQGIAIAALYTYTEHQTEHKSGLEFKEAFEKSLEELESMHTETKENSTADIYLAQKELLASLQNEVTDLETLEQNIKDASTQLSGTKLEAKISDYKDILHRVKKHLGWETEIIFPESSFILLANDLLPSQIEKLIETSITGVILKETSLNSHTAILLRASGIPSLIVKELDLEENSEIILDAHAGLVVTEPSQKDLDYAKQRLLEDKKREIIAREKRFDKAYTTKGKEVKVLANVTDVNSAKVAKEEGAQGIGLLRTEFLFKEEKPSLKLQTEAYKKIFALFDEITVRTLDVGGDKALPYIDLIQEENPFLGIRGVRLFQTHPEILSEQLHAIFLASEGAEIKIMFPMVSSVEEFVEAKKFAEALAQKLQIDISNILFGIMIEVPSVLFLLESFNEVVDFYSIGTNDLTQYLFAIERTHATLKTNDLSPAVFDAIALIVQKANKPVSICGELAANEKAIPTLLNIGIETLSVSGKNITQTKEIIRHV